MRERGGVLHFGRKNVVLGPTEMAKYGIKKR